MKNRLRTSLLFAVPAGILLSCLLCLLLSDTPLEAMKGFFIGPLRSVYNLGGMLNSAIPLLFGALASSIAIKSGNLNLGGEGQVYAGGFVATALALSLNDAGIPGVILCVGAGALVAGSAGALSGFAKMKWKTNEMISSFLLSCTIVLIVDRLITGPFMDRGSNLLTTAKVSRSMWLSYILLPSQLSSAVFIALAAAVLMKLLLTRTRFGLKLRLTGQSYRFAVYSGIHTGFYTWFPMFLSGALYGTGGALAVFGTYHSCLKSFHSNMGWNGLAVALLAGADPVAAIPAAIFYAWIESGARIAMQSTTVSARIASVIQAAVFLLITCSVFDRRATARIEGGSR